MHSKFFVSIENYIQNKSKKELYILIFTFIGLVFSLIFFYITPPIDSINNLQKQAYQNEKTAYAKNLIILENLKEQLKPKISKSLTSDFKKIAIDNYELLKQIDALNKQLHLKITTNIINHQDGLEFALQGEFEDFMEWLRTLESHHFVFIEDLHIFLKDEELNYNLCIKNLGNLI